MNEHTGLISSTTATVQKLISSTAATVQALRGLCAAAKAFRENPNDSKRDDRLTAWISEAEAVSKLWE